MPWRSLLAAWQARGHRATFYERDLEFYARHRDAPPECFPTAALQVRLYTDWESVRREALAEVRRADLWMVTSFCPSGATIASDLLAIRGPLRIFYDMDTPVTLLGLEEDRPATLDYLQAELIPEYDLYLSFTGGPTLQELRRRWGARAVAPLYLSIDPGAYRRQRARAEYRSRLSFLGTYAADRQKRLEELLFAPARRHPAEMFALSGALYPRDQIWPPNLRRWEHLRPSELAAFYSSSDFTLNLTREAMRQRGYSPQGRLLEAACCRTPIISDAWPGVEEVFEPGREILLAESGEDVEAHLRLPPTTLRALTRRACQRVRRDFSGASRVQELETILGARPHLAA